MVSSSKRKKYSLLDNSRFYILASSVLLSMAVFAWLRLQVVSDQLFYIRSQQVFGLISIAYWYLALVISPITYIVGKQRTKGLRFARRAIGVSAFYFAFLHTVIAFYKQLGGFGQLVHLPSFFIWSLVAGVIGLMILFVMAITSFDKIVKFMTFRRWKWLHRLVYAGGVLVLLHIWSIGTHLAYSGVKIAVFIALMVLIGLELYRLISLANKKYLNFGKAEVVIMLVVSWVIIATIILLIPSFVQNYHSQHNDHSETSFIHVINRGIS